MKNSVFFQKLPMLRKKIWRLRRIIQKKLHQKDGKVQSQHGEFRILLKLFSKNNHGYVVDIGAHDGSSFSNSSQFIDRGWNAILIEPLPGPYRKLENKYKSNPNVSTFNLAISNVSGKMNLHIGSDGPDGMMSSLSDDANDWFSHARSSESIEVDVDTITNILSLHNFPRRFDLLLVDTEGMDYECLLGLKFELFHPTVIVTEDYKWNVDKHNAKEALLQANGYKLYLVVECNSIWVDKEFFTR